MPLNNEMIYTAFRAAFVLTLDCMLRDSLEPRDAVTRPAGFLDVYPVLQGTAPQIQLECLLQTWDRLHRDEFELTPLDHCVVYAGYETLASMGELAARPGLSGVWKGPKSIETASDTWVTSKARLIQLTMDEQSVNHILRLEKKMDDRRPVFQVFSGSEPCDTTGDVTEIVGRWVASSAVVFGSVGLLTNEEQDILRIFFEEQSGLLR
ncbi:MAG: hypothetical protein O2856_01150 [Planctomycetota bacterium]|nr:hypothetical protein [Planctomycetota bacterium]